MPRFRAKKHELSQLLSQPHWQAGFLAVLTGPKTASQLLSPLLALLPRPELRWQAAWAVGQTVACLATDSLEEARTAIRRLLWSLNEESGNLGWGIPEAMGCALAQSPPLAKEYTRVMLSYIRDTGREDNYLEHPDLRAGAFWAAGHLAATQPDLVLPALPALAAGCREQATLPCGQAVLALSTLLEHLSPVYVPQKEEQGVWSQAYAGLLLLTNQTSLVEYLHADTVQSNPVGQLAKRALAAFPPSLCQE